jgi:flagellar hook-associated protein 2
VAGLTSVDGLISGLSTSQLISQLMQLEAQPQTALKTKVEKTQTVLSAYQSVNTKMTALRSAGQAMTDATAWQAMKATSSSATVAVSASTSSIPGAFTFDVTRLASAQSSVSSNAYTGMTALVTDGSPVVITKADGTAVTISTGDGSLAAVTAAINANKDAGVKAAAVQVSPGVYKLQLTSAATGQQGSFSASGLGGFVQLTAAQDAQITVGKGSAGEYTITSASNTFKDALPGTTFTVSALETSVTLSIGTDSGGIADKMQALVDAANAALNEIAKLAKYDANTKKAGPLLSDSAVRNLQQQILGTISSVLGNGTSASSIGIQLTKSGTLTFDRDVFLNAFAEDPTKVKASVTSSSTFASSAGLSGSISLVRMADGTKEGPYPVTVTQAATRAFTTLATSDGIEAGQVITIGINGKTSTYTTVDGETSESLAAALSAAAASNGIAMSSFVDDSGNVVVRASSYGSATKLTASTDGTIAIDDITNGQDVKGTINGVAATGRGQTLYTTGADAITLQVTLDEGDVATLGGASAGTVNVQAGIAQRLTRVAFGAVDPADGTLTNAIASQTKAIQGYNEQIASWDVRLQVRQRSLQRQFANLEVMLGKLQSQSNWLSGQIAGLMANSGK